VNALRIVLVLAASLAAQRASALSFVAHLTTDQETAAVLLTTTTGDPRPTPWGEAWLTLDDAQTALSFTVNIYNIDVTGSQTADTNDNLLAAHIHAGATGGVGSNAGVVFGFFGMPFNDVSPNDATVTPFAMGVGGTFFSKWDLMEGQGTTLLAQIPFITAGLSYLNFHTVQNPRGEIRGQILPVPDAGSTALLLGTGLAALLGCGLRRPRRC
jgi:hypothetical protein